MLLTPFRILMNPILLPAVLFAGGFIAFKLAEPECPPIPPAAQIFVLTGDPRRIPFALEMLEGEPKRRLYVIGAGTPTLDTRFGNQIEVESESKTTFENAIAIKRIAQRKLLTEIVVITTSDHIARAKFLIKKQLPYVRIDACPVPLTKMDAGKRLERWIQEYVKFIGTILGIHERA